MLFTNGQGQFQQIKKTFVFQDELTLKTQVVQCQAQVLNGQVDLQALLQNHLIDVKNLSFKVYNFRVNQYVEFQNTNTGFKVPRTILDQSPYVVLVKYSNSVQQTMSMNSIESKIHQENRSEVCSKGERSKQRMLLEVIQIVKKWRSLHESRKGKTMTLPQAAEILGLPKKSLDDYFYQLRMGEKYGFDFHAHMMDGIGVLRSFLKRFKNSRRSQKSQKLPTCLKIANEIQRYGDIIKPFIQEEQAIQMQQQKQQPMVQEHTKKQSIEKTFYNEFNYDFSKENDPFVNLGKSGLTNNILSLDFGSRENFDLFF